MAMAQLCQADDFDDFLAKEISDFDKFISDADKEFLNFLRNPWQEIKTEKPLEKRLKPEPLIPVVYKPTATPQQEAPKLYDVEEIIETTTGESRLKPATPTGSAIDAVDIASRKVSATPPSAPKTPLTTGPSLKAPTSQQSPKNSAAATTAPTAPSTPQSPKTPAVKPAPAPKSGALYTGGNGRDPFQFAGVTYHIDNKLKNAISLSSLSENKIADAYETLLRSDYGQLIDDFKTLRQNNLGNDWALNELIRTVAEKYVGKNESVVMRQFLLNKLGYRARMARKGNSELKLLVNPDCKLYACIFIGLNGHNYYDVGNKSGDAFYICRQDAPGATNSLQMDLKAYPAHSESRVKSTRSHGGTTVTVDVAKPLMEFINTIPQCDYRVYAESAVDPVVASQLLSQLGKAIEGKSELEAANLLLSFVQSAFDYKTDPEQFGYEKPFFVEELFYYPACDCEDRSVLYRYLVKNLLGLDVVLLDYPNHLATAVKFNTPVSGDAVNVGGQKYIICDPTFIGAGVGRQMPGLDYGKMKAIVL